MSPLELKRIKLEKMKVSAAKHEILFRIDERMEEIDRLKEHVKVQEAKEVELQEKIDAESKTS